MLDQLAGLDTERTRLKMVQEKPIPFPPEPAASIGVNLVRAAMNQADHNQAGATCSSRRSTPSAWVRLVTALPAAGTRATSASRMRRCPRTRSWRVADHGDRRARRHGRPRDRHLGDDPGTATDTEADELFVVALRPGDDRLRRPSLPSLEVGPGSVVRLAEGMRTTWTVMETLRKVYIA
jgi:hypothetical protein